MRVFIAPPGCAPAAHPRGTNKVHTVMQGMYRSLSYVGKHDAVVVDEPRCLLAKTPHRPLVKSCPVWVAAWPWASRRCTSATSS
jgi:hypothetical protein